MNKKAYRRKIASAVLDKMVDQLDVSDYQDTLTEIGKTAPRKVKDLSETLQKIKAKRYQGHGAYMLVKEAVSLVKDLIPSARPMYKYDLTKLLEKLSKMTEAYNSTSN